ncbi:alpha-glucuronidase family glycosyl hydrolase [Caulobacter hibisci]|uniref:Xylan alpha-1,2-glucuronidase n=1 Tax=Caulobacter hibisci TaxID=2035993 RepID=A0ABS0T0Q8_9CAUL|nr:alpha-glucuronidase family glycosyl hydrolase [Caulobacter hibisci]MBI1685111.1 alpha-glucuronidase [Caulobacter hibisci]
MRPRRLLYGLCLAAGLLLAPLIARAEDGYDLWLRYRPLPQAMRTEPRIPGPPSMSSSPALDLAQGELQRGLSGLNPDEPGLDAPTIELGTPKSSALVAGLKLPLKDLGDEGYLIRTLADGKTTVIAANTDIGVLYGVFHYLRLMQTGARTDKLDVRSVPKVRYRLLNHWDNLDRSVERGYAGQSLWDWWRLPDVKDPRYLDYARANASIGINGAVLNNVNAKSDSLTAPYIAKAAALADAFRPYGIKVYLSARFSSPIEIGGLKTADPLDPAVRAFWKAKADEIYKAIPDFGGFLVKANSEGQPGPQDYGRTHADGANMLAQAVGPHGGIVMWRAFVYSHEQPDDRAKQGYAEFKPFDGQFAENVIVQVKNGAIDFQPREPFHPLFGAMPKTNLGLEVQVTKEYLGFSTHLAYLGPMWEEVLKADTFAAGPGSTVAKVVDGKLHGYSRTLMAGVANIGTDRDWSGSQFDQANWYAFGRLAWDPEASSEAIARDWAAMTFSPDRRFTGPAVAMMMGSREAVVDYMTPIGLHHLMGRSHHYGPGPWVSGGERADWTSVYYHKADKAGIGFDRTASGSNAVAQYTPPAAAGFSDLSKIDEKDLLWFHHLPWTYPTRSGRPLWDELVTRYSRGVRSVEGMQASWATLAPYVDPERHAQVAIYLAIQRREAQWWRDASVAYFQSINGLPLPKGEAPPPLPLEAYERMQFPYAPGI